MTLGLPTQSKSGNSKCNKKPNLSLSWTSEQNPFDVEATPSTPVFLSKFFCTPAVGLSPHLMSDLAKLAELYHATQRGTLLDR